MTSRLVLHTRVVRGSGGGPDKTILNSPRFLEDSGYPMLCAYMRHPEDEGFARLEERARRWGAPLLPVDDFGALDRGLPGRFRDICERHGPVIWHGHDYKSNLLGLMVRRSYPMRLVTTVHGWGVKGSLKTNAYYLFDRFLLRYYDEVICVSEDLEARCLASGVAPERCWHVPNAIDTQEYRRRRPAAEAEARGELGVPPGRLVLGAVGRLSPEKAFDALIGSVTELVSRGHDLELWIVGEGPERSRLESRIAASSAPDRVKLLGYRGNTIPYYEAMDVYALSSTREGLPNALLEAMAFGIPVVATRIAGVPGLVEDGVGGLLIEPGSEAALTGALETLLGDRDLRHRLGQGAREKIETRHSFARRMDAIRAIYDHTLSDRTDS